MSDGVPSRMTPARRLRDGSVASAPRTGQHPDGSEQYFAGVVRVGWRIIVASEPGPRGQGPQHHGESVVALHLADDGTGGNIVTMEGHGVVRGPAAGVAGDVPLQG